MLDTDEKVVRQELLDRLVDAKLTGPTLQLASLNPSELPTRELPRGNNAALFMMYQAFCRASGESQAKKATFYKVAKLWRPCLSFHKDSNHSKCLTCLQLHAQLDNAPATHLTHKWHFLRIGLSFHILTSSMLRISSPMRKLQTGCWGTSRPNIWTDRCTTWPGAGQDVRRIC